MSSSSKNGKGKQGQLNKKINETQAALLIQKYGRGWLCRHFYRKFKCIMINRGKPGEELLQQYRQHLRQIIERHDTILRTEEYDDSNVNLHEICDYYFKLEKYEIAYDEMCITTEKPYLEYSYLLVYFDILSLTPTKEEIRLAAVKNLNELSSQYETFHYTKDMTIDIAMHIYAPKGTHLKNTRKSTWLCPVVGNDDALRFELNTNDLKKISLEKCMKFMTIAMRGSEETISDITEKNETRPKKKDKKDKDKKKDKKQK